MTSCGTTTYTDPDDYRANVPGASVDLALTSSDAFKARVTWIKLRRLALVTIEEAAPRVAFLSLDPSRIFISFPLQGESVWAGVRLRRGDFVLHSSGERFHHRVQSRQSWGLISMPAKELATYGRTLVGKALAPPETPCLLRPVRKTTVEVLRLHAHICRLAATRPDMMAHSEVARSVEQELIHGLINMLAGTPAHERRPINKRRADIMAHFEDALAAFPQHRLSELCSAIGVPLRTLRICCKAFVACSPLEYLRLRRLNQARSALSKADRGATVSIAGIARSHGFSEPGRFAGAYRALFGETPSATLLRTSVESA